MLCHLIFCCGIITIGTLHWKVESFDCLRIAMAGAIRWKVSNIALLFIHWCCMCIAWGCVQPFVHAIANKFVTDKTMILYNFGTFFSLCG